MQGFHLIPPAFAALIQVILIDIAMAGDNAIVIGLAATRVPKPDRRKVIFGGLAAAVVLRLVLAVMTATILERIGLMFAGGILLLWVAWRLYRDIHHGQDDKIGAKALSLHVFPHNEAAIALYRSAGFVEIERFERDVTRQTGEVWDTIFMRKEL